MPERITGLSVTDPIATRWQPDRALLRWHPPTLWEAALQLRADRDELAAAMADLEAVRAEYAKLETQFDASERLDHRRNAARRHAFDVVHLFYWARGLDRTLEVRARMVRLRTRAIHTQSKKNRIMTEFASVPWLHANSQDDVVYLFEVEPDQYAGLMAHAGDVDRAHFAYMALIGF